MPKEVVEGLKDLEKGLFELGSHTSAKSVGRRVLRNAGKPVAERMNNLAPDDPNTEGGLHESYHVSSRLNKRQKRAAKTAGKDDVEIYIGSDDPEKAIQQEFGNINHDPQPHARPAWEREARPTLNRIAKTMGGEIAKTAKRLEKKRAKAK